MKIKTSDCIDAIIQHFVNLKLNSDSRAGTQLLNSNMWKRLSKSGSGNNTKRVFENKSTKIKVYVISSDTEIISVSLSEPVLKFDEYSRKLPTENDLKTTLINTLKKLAKDNSEDEDFEDFKYCDIFYSDKLKSVWIDVGDGFDGDEIVEKEFLKISGVEHVIIEMEHQPNEEDTDWVKIK